MLVSNIPSYFRTRRERLMKANPSAVFIFPANAHPLRNPDVTYGYRQESNFHYLTGFEEPDSILVLTPSLSKPGTHKMVLFVLRRDLDKEMWNGERYGTDRARMVFGADEAYTQDEFDKRLPELLAGADQVFYRLGKDAAFDRRVLSGLEMFRSAQGRTGRGILAIKDPAEVLGEMRLFKSEEEVELLRKACVATALAHKMAMKEVRPGMNEYEVEALIDYAFRKNGCQRIGYGTIVAGGKNATCLHYVANNEPLKDGDLLLIDAGGEYNYYTSDITRTFPVGKSFTDAQAQAYELVLKSQKEAIAMAKPGVTIAGIHQHVCDVLTEGFISLGLMTGKREDILKSTGYTRFYPHRTSHYLGMDVHDVGLYLANGEPRKLEPGMVFTIEPGFYVQPSDTAVPAGYQNIGIRIEDDILITPTGCENLTISCPKERNELEALRG